MCYPTTPNAECLAEDVQDSVIPDEDRTEVDTQLPPIHPFFHDFFNAFFQIALELELDVEPDHIEENQQLNTQQVEFENIPYRMQNAPTNYISEITDFDEVSPQFFAQEDSFAPPAFLHQEL